MKSEDPFVALFSVIACAVVLGLFCWIGDPNKLGPGHVVCRSSDAIIFDDAVFSALPPGGMSESRRYDWRLETAHGVVHITGDCIHTPAAEHP